MKHRKPFGCPWFPRLCREDGKSKGCATRPRPSTSRVESESMPLDSMSGAEGNRYGHECGKQVALAIGAAKLRANGSNECLIEGKRVVIKCSRSRGLQQVGVLAKMLDRLDAIVGAFENPDTSYDIFLLPTTEYRSCMRVRSNLCFVKRNAFTAKGTLLKKLPAGMINVEGPPQQPCVDVDPPPQAEEHEGARIREILATVEPLAAEYYRLTGKPLGVTGEVAEYVAAEILGLKLVPARTAGYDALRGEEKIQIKGRAYGKNAKPGQRISRIKLNANCNTVLLVLLDNTTLEAREIWEAPYPAVCECLSKPGSKARERGALGVSAFKRIAEKIWESER